MNSKKALEDQGILHSLIYNVGTFRHVISVKSYSFTITSGSSNSSILSSSINS